MKKVGFILFLLPIFSVSAQTQTIDNGDLKFTGNRDNILSVNGDYTANKPMLVIGEQQKYGVGFKWDSGLNLDIVQFDNQNIFTTSPAKLGHFRVRDKVFYWFGNVGIGTDAPDSKLHLYKPSGSATYPTSVSKGDVVQSIRSNNNGVEIGNSRGFNDRKAWILARHSSVASYGKFYSVFHLQPDVGDKTYYKGVSIGYDVSEDLPIGTHLAVDGKVGIGTTAPDSKLTVKGNIHAEEVKVDLSVPGPDYVFKEDYALRSLEEVLNFIKEHGHLPNIPSAKEMEVNGIQLGEMNMKLLEKIEELTLYTLEQEGKIQDYKKQLELERFTNKDQEKRISNLEKLLTNKLEHE